MNQVLVLRDDLLLLSVDEQSEIQEIRNFVATALPPDVKVLIFGGLDQFVDARATPPEVTDAARLVDAWLAERAP